MWIPNAWNLFQICSRHGPVQLHMYKEKSPIIKKRFITILFQSNEKQLSQATFETFLHGTGEDKYLDTT